MQLQSYLFAPLRLVAFEDFFSNVFEDIDNNNDSELLERLQ